ncbi:outer membrane protein assembly factor BamA [Phenylobacterium sp. Root77]|uniref:outer membrane protein assembly factor BamA n=1 Tax=unclassified Phenylobacterium TaxID=2640670 RepID=UPI0006F80935|nr:MULTISPECIES: outer membrane protein assembly factor BamA [unclassified Phenylobacterium]KQW71551.1 outer membrane protein assembly factor BamA [Phenylobacterium sp. Root1277]KQW94471.1 outer membrane protein assembly factor BamA [Phenylobacterium sp. Root1290]KRC44165.1 outer membrane protein assembly factor BamA [Phenylobacterium sp. Root77]
MQRPRASRAALASGLALLMGSTAIVIPSAALAQEQATQPQPQPAPPQDAGQQSGVVQRIIVRGNERIEQSTVLSYLPIQPGETLDPAKADLALKTLFRTDLFADVKIELQGSDMIVTVVENPIINKVVFEGNSGLKEDKLRDEVSVRPRGIFTRAKVQQDVQRIVELYRRSGRISATVTPKIVELPQKRVDLIFEINEGPKSGVLRVNFLGNSEFSDNDLRDVVVTEQSSWYKFFSNNANYDPDRLEYDKEQLRKHYRNRGFYDFRVVSAIAELAPDKNGFVITYTLDEGKEYRFGKVTVETELQKLDKNVLQQLVPIRSGEIYQDEKIEAATDSLTFAAGAAGFAAVDVRPRYTPNRETGLVDVVFQVREGPRVYVERIDVTGNTRTLDYVIRRELNLVEGDAYNRALVDRSRNNIRALGFFKDVTIDEAPGSAPDRTTLQVKVEEQPTGELSFSAGYSSVDQLILDLGVTERNFRGRGQSLRARVSVGSLRQQIDFGFTEPRFLGRDLGAGVDLYSYRYDLTEYSAYKTVTVGGNIRMAFPLTLNSRMSTRYTLRQEDVQIDDAYCDPTAPLVSLSLCAQRGKYLTSLIGYTYLYDRRNDPINPTRGFRFDVSQDLAGLGGDVNYISTEVTGGWYHGFNKDFILSVTGQGGYIAGWNGDTVRVNSRFYKGGNNFRGFETAGIGPRDTNFGRSDALGGRAYAIGSAELTIPTGLPEQYGIKAALFTDVGTLGLLDDKDKLKADGTVDPLIYDDMSLRATAGLSVFWRSPMGPIRFDFSQVLAKEDYDKTETFRFSTSTRF